MNVAQRKVAERQEERAERFRAMGAEMARQPISDDTRAELATLHAEWDEANEAGRARQLSTCRAILVNACGDRAEVRCGRDLPDGAVSFCDECMKPPAVPLDYGPKQATDPRKRHAMRATGNALGERRDV